MKHVEEIVKLLPLFGHAALSADKGVEAMLVSINAVVTSINKVVADYQLSKGENHGQQAAPEEEGKPGASEEASPSDGVKGE